MTDSPTSQAMHLAMTELKEREKPDRRSWKGVLQDDYSREGHRNDYDLDGLLQARPPDPS
jgi:hypothetical protein